MTIDYKPNLQVKEEIFEYPPVVWNADSSTWFNSNKIVYTGKATLLGICLNKKRF